MSKDERIQVGIRFPPDIHARAEGQAKRTGISLNELVVRCVAGVFNTHDKHKTRTLNPKDNT